MGAPVGNQFWKLRSKHGRDKIFSTPKILWKEACNYFEWAQNNPLMTTEVKVVNIGDYQSKIDTIQVPKMRAFTLGELCIYLGCNSKYFNDLEDSLKGKNDDLSKDFSEIITCIKDVIYTQKFTGAAAGLLNPNIIARDLGLHESSKPKDPEPTPESNIIEIKIVR